MNNFLFLLNVVYDNRGCFIKNFSVKEPEIPYTESGTLWISLDKARLLLVQLLPILLKEYMLILFLRIFKEPGLVK